MPKKPSCVCVYCRTIEAIGEAYADVVDQFVQAPDTVTGAMRLLVDDLPPAMRELLQAQSRVLGGIDTVSDREVVRKAAAACAVGRVHWPDMRSDDHGDN